MIVVNTDFVTGFEISELLGLVRGNTVRAKHIGRELVARFTQVAGGEITGYTEMLAEARNEALGRMAADGDAERQFERPGDPCANQNHQPHQQRVPHNQSSWFN